MRTVLKSGLLYTKSKLYIKICVHVQCTIHCVCYLFVFRFLYNSVRFLWAVSAHRKKIEV